MSHLHLIDWRARVDSGKHRPAVRRFVRRVARAALFIATIGYHMKAAFGGLCFAALFLKSCGAV